MKNKDKKEVKVEVPCIKCAKEADIGAHGIKDGGVYSEHFCYDCWNASRKELNPVYK